MQPTTFSEGKERKTLAVLCNNRQNVIFLKLTLGESLPSSESSFLVSKIRKMMFIQHINLRMK